MITKAQLKKIHALKDDLNMDEEDYRAVLQGFSNDKTNPIRSSKEMSVGQASSIIGLLERVAQQIPTVQKRLFASRQQAQFIASLWKNVSRAKDPIGRARTLEAFLSRRFQVRRSDHIPRTAAPRIIKSLRAMNERQRLSQLS
jgi:hypothetical protein